MADVMIGIDVGGTNFRLGVVRGAQVVWEKRVQADFAGLCRNSSSQDALNVILQILLDTIVEARAAYPEVGAIGIGFPGFIDPHTRCVLSSPNFPGLLNVDFVAPLQTACSLPVVLENDAAAAAFGEYVLSGKTQGDLIYIGLGTGVGGGLVMRGKLHGGTHGMAMEIGHLIVEPAGRPCGCGNRGCLEQYASASGVAQSYFTATGIKLPASEIARLADCNDNAAIRAFEQAGETLAVALAHIAKVLDVRDVVIGGGLSASWPLIQPTFERRLEHDLIPALRGKLIVTVSQAQDQAGIIGAARLAKEIS